jgi:peroxiredoxin
MTDPIPTPAPHDAPASHPSVGWGVVHLFVMLAGRDVDREGIIAAVKKAQAADHQVISVATLGHKADACFMALGPDLWVLRALQADLQAAGAEVVDSFVSLTEISEYAQGVPEEMRQARLYPQLPPAGKDAWCFYPMSKQRGDKNNWFTLPYDERKDLMMGHGTSGRKFAGRVLQVVTGSTGLDDFEWGVTLFAVHPDDLKDVVYTMRFDEASSLYADFGQFVTGLVCDSPEQLVERVLR